MRLTQRQKDTHLPNDATKGPSARVVVWIVYTIVIISGFTSIVKVIGGSRSFWDYLSIALLLVALVAIAIDLGKRRTESGGVDHK